MLMLEQGFFLLFLLTGGCKVASKPQAPTVDTSKPIAVVQTMHVTSTAFKSGAVIPVRFSCQGENISPPLAWTNAPAGTKSFAIVCEDPDAPRGTFIHWVIYNIPPSGRSLSEGVPQKGVLLDGTRQGKNGAE